MRMIRGITGPLSMPTATLAATLFLLIGCKEKQAQYNEPSQQYFEDEEQLEREDPDYMSGMALLKWSRVDNFVSCGLDPKGDPYCDVDEHTRWEPAEGTRHFNEEPHVYSRIRKAWNLDDTLWIYLIETRPADYECPTCGPWQSVAYVTPGTREIEGFADLGLKGALGSGPDSVDLVKDRRGTPYLRSAWATEQAGVRDSLVEYHSLIETTRTIRILLSGNNQAACDSLGIPCYRFTFSPADEGAILPDTLRFQGEGTKPDASGGMMPAGDTQVAVIENPFGERLACPDYLSVDSARAEGSKLFGILGKEAKMHIGGGLVSRVPLDSMNPVFDFVSLKSGDLYPVGSIERGFFAAGQHEGMHLKCGYWWKDDQRRKSGGYRDSNWLVTYLIPLPVDRDADCTILHRFTGDPETAYCLVR